MSGPPPSFFPPPARQPPRRWPIAVGVLAAVLIVAGAIAAFVYVRKKQIAERDDQLARDAAELTEGADEDASDSLRDEDYRFEIVHPGDGWKVAGPETMLELDIDALGGAFFIAHDGEVRMWVGVAEWPGDDLRARAEQLPSAVGLLDIAEQKLVDERFHDFPAVRVSATGKLNGMHAALRGVCFQRGDHVFTVVSLSVTLEAEVRLPLETGIDAFRPLAGELTPRPPLPTPDRRGAGWRIREQVLESSSGLRVTAPPGCAIDGGSVAHANTGFDEAIIACRNPDRHVYVTPYLVPNATESVLRELLESVRDGLTLDEERITAKVAGEAVELRRYRSEGDLESLMGLAHLGGDLYAIVRVDYGLPLRARVGPTLDATLANLGALEGGVLTRVQTELREAEPITRTVTGMAYRDGVVLDFEHGIRWPLPTDAMWRVRIGRHAAATRADARILLHEPTIDLVASISVVPEQAEPAFHDMHREGDPGAAVTGFSWGEAKPKITRHATPTGVAQERLVATEVRGGTGYLVTIEWPVGYKERGETFARALLSELRLSTPPKPSERDSVGYLDRRFGFALKLPPDATLTLETQGDDRAEVLHTVGSTGDVLGASAFALDEGKIDVLVDKTIKDITTALNRKTGAIGKRSKTNLAGIAAERITFELGPKKTYEVIYFVRNHVLYVVAVGASPQAAKEYLAQFRLVPANTDW